MNALSGRVIAAAIAVHRALGPGHLEDAYESAFCVELTCQDIAFQRQHRFVLRYEGVVVGESRVDVLIENQLVVEIKAVEMLAPIHAAQTLSYCRGLNLHLDLLINFNEPVLKDGVKRIINPHFQ